MPIMTKPPEWYAQGSEPPENKKTIGWEIDERPPAGWFNWLFHRGYQSLLEIASALGDHRDAASGVHGVSAEDTVESAQGAQAKADAAAAVVQDNLDIHASDATNPHSITAAQVGAVSASDGAGFHNSIYRGKNLGTSVSAEQYARIADGTFKDMYIGDYWTINGVQYIIAAFNYYYNTGDTALTQHHVTLVPGSSLYTHVMNDTATTEGGYMGSKMYAEGLDQAKSMINSAFPGHVVTHRRYLSNATSDGEASAGAWVDSDVELMNEAMVYGGRVNGSAVSGLYDTGIEKAQLPLFRHRHDLIGIRVSWWLRDVCSASDFAYVSNVGNASRNPASGADGVRPAFSIS